MPTTHTLSLLALSACLVAANPGNPGSNSTVNSTDATAPIQCPSSGNSTYTCGDTIFDIDCYTDLFEHDLRTVYAATMNDCMDACAKDGQCVAVSYDDPGACYLKYAIGQPIPNPRIWSARSNAIEVIPSCPNSNQTTYSPSNGKSYVIECDIDHYNNDFAMVYALDLQGCITACVSSAACVDVVLSGTACYLKNALGASQWRPGSGLAGARCVAGCPVPTTSSTSSLATTTSVNSFQAGTSTQLTGSGPATIRTSTLTSSASSFVATTSHAGNSTVSITPASSSASSSNLPSSSSTTSPHYNHFDYCARELLLLRGFKLSTLYLFSPGHHIIKLTSVILSTKHCFFELKQHARNHLLVNCKYDDVPCELNAGFDEQLANQCLISPDHFFSKADTLDVTHACILLDRAKL
ncbi:hypothetical protein LTR86_002009 [Recurvomyces mirabilis]|nr:hypothetical protein LTR86_002009 [Recurvomyces mirabilis]